MTFKEGDIVIHKGRNSCYVALTNPAIVELEESDSEGFWFVIKSKDNRGLTGYSNFDEFVPIFKLSKAFYGLD